MIWSDPGFVDAANKTPMSLTCLFCLTTSGFQALKELGIEIEVYCASEIDEQAMQVGIEKLSTVNINSLPLLPSPSSSHVQLEETKLGH